VLFVAEVEYVVVTVPDVNRQEGSTPDATVIDVGVPTFLVTFTVFTTCGEGPMQPSALT
jgi:hypothetical protein